MKKVYMKIYLFCSVDHEMLFVVEGCVPAGGSNDCIVVVSV